MGTRKCNTDSFVMISTDIGILETIQRLLRTPLSSSSRDYPCTGYRLDGWCGETQKKVLLAKLEEEEGGQDVAREQLRGAILVLMMYLPMPGWSGGGIVSIDTLTRVHQLAFSLPRCCPASRAPECHSPRPAPTSHSPGVWLVSGAVRTHHTAPSYHLHPDRWWR